MSTILHKLCSILVNEGGSVYGAGEFLKKRLCCDPNQLGGDLKKPNRYFTL